MREPIGDLVEDSRGLTTVEYLILLALIGTVVFSAWKSFGDTVARKVGFAEESIATLFPTGSSGSSSALLSGIGDVAGVSAGAFANGEDIGGVWNEDGLLGAGDSTGAAAIARGVADGAIDVVVGTAEGLAALAVGTWNAVTSPVETAAAVADAVTHPRETAAAAWGVAKAVASSTYDAASDLVEACGRGDGYACSRGVTNVAAAFIPVGAAGNAVRGAGAVRAGTAGAKRIRVVARRTRDDRVVPPSRVIREDVDGIDARDILDEGGDRREVVFTRDADGNGRLRTSDSQNDASFPAEETARAHNHPGAADEPAWQNPSPADIDYVRETGGSHAIVHDRGVTVINERTRVGNDMTDRVRNIETGEVTNTRYNEVQNATRVDSNDVRISTDADGQLRIDPLPDSSHPDYLPITPIGRERIGTSLDPTPDGWRVVDHNVGTINRPHPTGHSKPGP